VNFLLALIELFLIDVTAESLRPIRDKKCGNFDEKCQVEGVAPSPHQSFSHG